MRVVAILVMAAMVSCGGDDDKTTGDLCDFLGDAYCHRANSCGFVDYNGCFQATKKACCIDEGICGSPLDTTEVGNYNAWENACTMAIAEASCQDIDKGVLPATCLMKH